MDFKPFIDAILTGTPLAILAAAVGVIWQMLYTRSRDRLQESQIDQELRLAEQQFKNGKRLEKIKFEYEQRQWREGLAQELTVRLFEARVDNYVEIWRGIEVLSTSKKDKLTPEAARKLAEKIQSWRYAKGGFLAENTTRDAAYLLQKALWQYDTSSRSYKQLRKVRRLFRDALRADLGLGEYATGQTIYDKTSARQKIRDEIEEIKTQMDIKKESQQEL
jgi:hypothetical protein